MRWEIWDAQVGALLAEGTTSLDGACERPEQLLTATREQVEATGDSVEAMVLEWEILDVDTGRVVAGHSGAPEPMSES
ncbi:hypothetical protein GCM10007147_45380 [Nocardiopsis kunsanensis]|uniref:Uncharacterized protein n=1 Tax=Nocardiopsis kunsanensis TaxID=141693 RepID=A0A919CMI9_9ACTN|nr:hypothetical protein [Nocardiopsis kunsanensis]GHD37389.1 hypothetical protein GCM10007147_45380 [Nocardiopsis kunsanensis]